MSDPSLIELYSSYFQVLRADTPALRERAFRLRFQVYCVENGFEDPSHFPDGMERDRFDDHSVHSLLIHRQSGLTAGTVRLILPGERSPPAIPFRRVCKAPTPFPTRTTAEVSRFSISKDFRRRRTDGSYPDEKADGGKSLPGDIRLIPSMTLGLIQDVVRISSELGLTHWCAVMMPSLLRLLTRLGIHFVPLGPLVDFRGKRQPCYRDLNDLLAQVLGEQPEIWSFLTENGALWPAPQRMTAASGR